MNNIPKYLVIAFAWLAVLYPLWVRFSSLEWALDASLISNLFPMFGLLAFALLWLHAISGVFEPWLRKQINFDRFVDTTATIIFVCIIIHPLLLLIQLDFTITDAFLYYGSRAIWLAIIGWILLITYDIGKFLKKCQFFQKHWSHILLISTIGFLLIFFHSLEIGSDLQSGPLRIIWIFYGVTAILATIWTYGIKRFFR